MKFFFDLDGTLTNPQLGITRCFQYAMEGMGHKAWPTSTLEKFIGPPLQDSFRRVLNTTDQMLINEAIRLYRERYSHEGLFENELYPGIPDSLLLLRDSGHDLLVVTSKPTIYAERIVRHFELDPLFPKTYGSALSGEYTDKRELIAHVLDQEGVLPDEAIMIGDRSYDIVGAKMNKVVSVGVLWGFGSVAELLHAGADMIVSSVATLTPRLLEWPP